MQEREIQYLEEHIPELAESAVTQAYWQSLAAGNSVLESENGMIYERFPDGSSQIVKEISQRLGCAYGRLCQRQRATYECGNRGETEIIMNDLPRLRMFAEPNGSGKSTIKSVIRSELLGVYIFDNSTHQQIWTAEITDGEFLEMKTDRMPAWFKAAVWDKFSEI